MFNQCQAGMQEEAFTELQTLDRPTAAPESEDISLRQILTGVSALLHSDDNFSKLMGVGLLTAIGTGLNFLAPYLFGETIKLLASDEDNTEIAGVDLTFTAMIVILVSAYTLSQALPNVRGQLLARVKINAEKHILKNATEHFLKKSLNFHVNTSIGEMIVLYQKTYSVTTLAGPLYGQIVPVFIEIAIASALLSSQYGIKIGLSLMGMLATYTGYSIFTAKPIIRTRAEYLTDSNQAWEYIIGSIERYKTIHDCGKYDKTIDDVVKYLDKMAKTDRMASTLPMNVGLGHMIISRAFMAFIVIMVGFGVKKGKYSTGDFAVLMAYLNQLSYLLPEFGSAVNQLFAAYPDLKFVFSELIKADEVVDNHPDVALELPSDEPPSIEFENVSFEYPAKRDGTQMPMIFNHLSFKIDAGKKVAFVSESATGKTTLFNLIFGHYKPNCGTIKINGQDITRVSLTSLQSNIRIFGQKPGLFKGTVRENICFGAGNPKEINDEMIWRIAALANLTDFLKDLTLDKDVGERGDTLSGGQQQKVSILRGLLKTSRIMLLDEITASLDSKSATDVMKAMDQASHGQTTLAITHKLTEAQHADQIILLSEGKVLAQGTHAELLENCKAYQELWHSYTSKDSKPSSNTKLV